MWLEKFRSEVQAAKLSLMLGWFFVVRNKAFGEGEKSKNNALNA